MPKPECCILKVNDIIDGYLVESKLGEGSFGIVYKVQDVVGRTYALKLLKLWAVTREDDQQSLLDRFNMEFETGRINSNYLVHAIGHGMINGNPYIVMEYCPNGDLKKYIGINISEQKIGEIAYCILMGLYDLHRNGKVHRDLKPENILFDENNMARLTDFGICGDKNKRMTKRDIFGNSREIFGTYAYMPYEQLVPKRDVTVLPTTDIFSFGVVMYELFTGIYPFGPIRNKEELAEYNRKKGKGIWDKDTLKRKKVNSKWISVIEKTLYPDYKKRYQSTIDVVTTLGINCNVNMHTKKEVQSSKPYDFNTDKIGLKIMQGEEFGRVYAISDMLPSHKSGVLKIGREDISVKNSIEIKEINSCYISRSHATIEKNIDVRKWYIRDGQWMPEYGWKRSTNGTFLNSEEVTDQGMTIEIDDIITIGEVTLKVIRI